MKRTKKMPGKIRILGAAAVMLFALAALSGRMGTAGAGSPAVYAMADEVENESEFEPFIRIDRDDPEACERELENLRIITEGAYVLSKPKEKYGIDPGFKPNLTGLDNLNASASAQFNEWQFRELADTLRNVAQGREIYIIDLRRESHVLINGLPFSQYGLHNWSNEGLNLEEIEEKEQELFGALIGKEFRAYTKEDDDRGEMAVYKAESLMSEKELVESEGFHYVRIPVVDHTWPSPDEVDTFLDLIGNVDSDKVWLHFHCHAGSGRTGAFLVMYDKIKNPEVAMEDICVRQSMLGASYMLQTDPSAEYKIPLYEEKRKRVIQFGRYVEEVSDVGGQVTWSEWLSEQDAGQENEKPSP